jgi:hypothetical protein
MPLIHEKVSELPDLPDTTQVRPSDWNADHLITDAEEGDVVTVNGDGAVVPTKILQLVAVRFNQSPPASPQDGDMWKVATGTSPNRTVTLYLYDQGTPHVIWEIEK